jgi:hypothetical protein
MLVQFELRHDTLAGWTATNPVIGNSEPVYEEDTGLLRIGNGVDPYLSLPPQTANPALLQAIADQIEADRVAAETARDEAVAASGGVVPASETTIGVVELATAAETATGTANNLAVHPAGLASVLATFDPGSGTVPDATTTVAGKVELATNTEAITGTDAVRAVTPAALAAALAAAPAVPDASDTVKGKVELATTTEATTGTDTVRAVTPAGLAAGIAAQPTGTTTVRGPLQLATTVEATTGTGTAEAVTPAGVAAHVTSRLTAATETAAGVVELATSAEALAGTDTVRAMTPAAVKTAIDLSAGRVPTDGTTGDVLTRTSGGYAWLEPAGAAGTYRPALRVYEDTGTLVARSVVTSDPDQPVEVILELGSTKNPYSVTYGYIAGFDTVGKTVLA